MMRCKVIFNDIKTALKGNYEENVQIVNFVSVIQDIKRKSLPKTAFCDLFRKKCRFTTWRPFVLHELFFVLLNDLNYDALFCDVIDDFNFYYWLEALKRYLRKLEPEASIASGGFLIAKISLP